MNLSCKTEKKKKSILINLSSAINSGFYFFFFSFFAVNISACTLVGFCSLNISLPYWRNVSVILKLIIFIFFCVCLFSQVVGTI